MARCTLQSLGLLLFALVVTGCRPSDTTTPATSAKTNSSQAIEAPQQESAPLAMLEGVPDDAVTRDGNRMTKVDLRSLSGETLRTAIKNVATIDSVQEVLVTGEEVTDEWLVPLTNMKSLKRLRAPQTQVTGKTIELLATHAALELLDLTDVKSFGESDSTSIAGLRQLKELNLMNTGVDDQVFAAMGGLPQLRKVRLRGTQITGENVGDLSQSTIIDLELSETAFGNTGMSSIAKMPKLQKLNLWMTKIDDKGLAAIKDKDLLTLLNLDNVAGITDASLPTILSLENLELLHIGGTSISSESIDQLATLKKLKTLFITRLGVPEELAGKLRQELPALERLEH